MKILADENFPRPSVLRLRGVIEITRKRSLVSSLYRLARLANDMSTLASGNPNKVAIRLKNKLVGRTLGRFLFK